jgi:L-lactate dehydrogenase complex protein LldE
MIRDQYPGLFEELGNENLGKQFAALLPRVYELSEFLTDKLRVEDVGAYFPHRVTYHASCHGLRGLHVGDRPFRLLSKVRGLELIPLANLERCCGFGGTFSIKNAEVSTAMLDAKLGDVLATGAEYCTALDNSCLMHLGGVLHRQKRKLETIHLAGILASTEEHPYRANA